jgi:hypothetical protein
MLRILTTPVAAICLVAALQSGPAEANHGDGLLLEAADGPGQPAAPISPQLALAGLAGSWQGVYSYPDQGRDAVAFAMTLEVRGDTCRGRTEEPNSFAEPSVAYLYADVECQLAGGTLSPRLLFRKTYDGTGGQTHSVDYIGEVSPDGRSVTGTWRVGTQSGRFSLTKQ